MAYVGLPGHRHAECATSPCHHPGSASGRRHERAFHVRCRKIGCLGLSSSQRSKPVVIDVDDAEYVAFGICQHDEVRIVGIAVPVNTASAERHRPVDFFRLLSGIGSMEVQMQTRMILQHRLAALQSGAPLASHGSGPWSPANFRS